MTPERWKAIETLFESCLALAPSERAALLENHAAEDPELVTEVAALLVEAEQTGRLEALLEAPARTAMEAMGALGPGDRVGAYRVEKLLGEGGMGKVFLARRDDEAFEQEVAIKLLPPGAAARGLRGRFLAERQILARLEHPHIARLLDGGTTDDGQPFLVMEYVDGDTLLDHCDRERLGIPERLCLFRRVASAVEHAHRHLVVHRDIKPANILVHPEMGPKLLDFGIAKMLEPGASGLADPTLQQDRLLTPDYASPEQILGEPVTTLSDVYSLGVLLFELLTGERPRRLQDKTPLERVRELTETAPPLPSSKVRRADEGSERQDDTHPARLRRLEPAQLSKQLEGDLDVIVLRALAPDPGRRYGSVAELSADVERFLSGEPVLARPDSWGYRTGKLVQRHPWGAAAVVAIALLLLALAAGLSVHASRLSAERDRALQAEAEAKTVSGFLKALFEVADPAESRGQTVTAQELLERGAAIIESELAEEPRVQASLLITLGDAHSGLGLRRRAEALHRRALEHRIELLGDDHPETAQSRDRLGNTLREIARFDEAEEELRRALATREARLSEDDPALAETRNNLGLLLLERGQFEQAEPLLRRALEVRLARLGLDHDDTAASQTNLGILLKDTRRFDEASALFEAVLENRLRRLGEDHPSVANSVHMLATLRYDQGDLETAEGLFERAIRIRRRVLPAKHPLLAPSLNNMASLLHDQWRLEEAARYYREALDISEERPGGHVMGYAISLNNYGSLLEDLGRYGEAEQHYRRSAALRKEIQGEDSRSYRRMISSLGRLATRAGQLELAEKLLVESEAWYRENVGPDEPDRIRTLERLAVVRRAQGRDAESATLLRSALERAERTYDAGHRILAELSSELAMTLAASADPTPCHEAVSAARAVTGQKPGTDITRGRVELAAGLCHRALGRDSEADQSFALAEELLEPLLGAGNHWVRAAKAG